MLKKAIVVSCFFRPDSISRGYLAYKFLSESFDVKVLYSRFSHKKKQSVEHAGHDFVAIDAGRYARNISLARVLSHAVFARNVQKYLKKETPDLLYVLIPPNIGGYLAMKAIRGKCTKVVVDVVDICPEALPVPQGLKILGRFTYAPIWKYFRTYALKRSDYILSESQFFVDKLKASRFGRPVKVVHLAKPVKRELERKPTVERTSDTLVIGYLGSLNNIYDFDSLVKIATTSERKVKLHVIGDGEKRDWLLRQLNDNHVEFEYHGEEYDEAVKWEILSSCDFGYNGFKDSTEVALSYKSIDYLSYGLPLINSAKGDTWNLVQEHSIGMNFSSQRIEELVEKLGKLGKQDLETMKRNVREVFMHYFDWTAYVKKMGELIGELFSDGEELNDGMS